MSVTVLNTSTWNILEKNEPHEPSHRRKSCSPSSQEMFPALIGLPSPSAPSISNNFRSISSSSKKSKPPCQSGTGFSYSQAAKKAMKPRQPGEETPPDCEESLVAQEAGELAKGTEWKKVFEDIGPSEVALDEGQLSLEPCTSGDVSLTSQSTTGMPFNISVYDFPSLTPDSSSNETKADLTIGTLFPGMSEEQDSAESMVEEPELEEQSLDARPLMTSIQDAPSPSGCSDDGIYCRPLMQLVGVEEFNIHKSQKMFDVVASSWPLRVMEEFLALRNLYFDGETKVFRPILDCRPQSDHTLEMYSLNSDGAVVDRIRSKGFDTRHYTFVIKRVDGQWIKCMTLKDRYKSKRVLAQERAVDNVFAVPPVCQLPKQDVPFSQEQKDEEEQREMFASILIILCQYPRLATTYCYRDTADWMDCYLINIAALIQGTEVLGLKKIPVGRTERSPSPHGGQKWHYRQKPPLNRTSPPGYQLFSKRCNCPIPVLPKGFTFDVPPPCCHHESLAYQRETSTTPPPKINCTPPSPSRSFPATRSGPRTARHPLSPGQHYHQIVNLPRPQHLVPAVSRVQQPPSAVPVEMDPRTLSFFGRPPILSRMRLNGNQSWAILNGPRRVGEVTFDGLRVWGRLDHIAYIHALFQQMDRQKRENKNIPHPPRSPKGPFERNHQERRMCQPAKYL